VTSPSMRQAVPHRGAGHQSKEDHPPFVQMQVQSSFFSVRTDPLTDHGESQLEIGARWCVCSRSEAYKADSSGFSTLILNCHK
jgi:hypothetical protein